MCVTDRHDMTAVKVALNPNTTNQPRWTMGPIILILRINFEIMRQKSMIYENVCMWLSSISWPLTPENLSLVISTQYDELLPQVEQAKRITISVSSKPSVPPKLYQMKNIQYM